MAQSEGLDREGVSGARVTGVGGVTREMAQDIAGRQIVASVGAIVSTAGCDDVTVQILVGHAEEERRGAPSRRVWGGFDEVFEVGHKLEDPGRVGPGQPLAQRRVVACLSGQQLRFPPEVIARQGLDWPDQVAAGPECLVEHDLGPDQSHAVTDVQYAEQVPRMAPRSGVGKPQRGRADLVDLLWCADHDARGYLTGLVSSTVVSPVKDDVDALLASWCPGPARDLTATGALTRMQLIVRASAARKEARAARLGLPAWAPATLMAIRRRGIDSPASRARLAAQLGVTQAAMTKQIRRLTELGLITEHPDRDDARQTLLRLSSSGMRVSDELADLDSDAVVFAGLSAAQLATLDRLLRQIRHQHTHPGD